MIGPEHGAQTAESCDDLIGDEQDVMLAQHFLNRGPVAFGWRHDAASAQNRLADEGCNRIGPFLFDQRLKLGHQMGGELRLGHVGPRPAEVIGCLCVDDLRQGQVEFLVKQLKPGQRSRHQTRSMIPAPAADDLLLGGPSQDIIVVPDQLDVGFVGIGPGQPEIDLGHALWRAIKDHLGQGDAGFGPVTDIGVVIGQFARLIGDGLGDLLTSVSDVHAVKARERIQQPRAIAVGDVASLGCLDDPLRDIAAREFGQMGRRMKEILAVPLGQLIVGQHLQPLLAVM